MGYGTEKAGGNGSKIEWKYVYRFACAIALTMIASSIFFCFWWTFVRINNQTGHLTGYGNLSMAGSIYILLYVLVGRWVRAFKIGVERIINIMVSQVMALAIVAFLEIFISMAITGQWRFCNELSGRYFAMWAIQSTICGFIAVPMIKLYRKKFPPIEILEIYGDYKNGLCLKVNGLQYKYRITRLMRYDEDGIMEEIKHHEAVLINDIPSKNKNKILKYCFDINKRVYAVPKISDVIINSAENLNLLDTPMLLFRNRETMLWQRFVKRLLDILLSFLALVAASPVFIVTAWLIHHEDGGPVFFKQKRCTRNGEVFTILKFRSMVVDAEADGKPHPAVQEDDRITKVGRVIRAWRIDELPQLVNILKGDMSIVGPRPERIEHVEKYTEEIPEFRLRLKMKGGLTGYAQVYGKYNTSALDKLKLDLIYITNYSLVTDIQIIFETIKILCLKESTEGFRSPEEDLVKNKHDAVNVETV